MVGATLTGVIGFFVVVACAATLHRDGLHVDDAAVAARALAPVAGHAAGTLFAVGLLGAALLAAAVLPLSTGYSVSEFTGSEAALDLGLREAPVFYLSSMAVSAVAAVVVLLPGMPLVPLLVTTQALNAVLLVPLLVLMQVMSRDEDVMGEHRVSWAQWGVQLIAIAGVTLSVVFLLG